jgi:hypothetical protein
LKENARNHSPIDRSSEPCEVLNLPTKRGCGADGVIEKPICHAKAEGFSRFLGKSTGARPATADQGRSMFDLRFSQVQASDARISLRSMEAFSFSPSEQDQEQGHCSFRDWALLIYARSMKPCSFGIASFRCGVFSGMFFLPPGLRGAAGVFGPPPCARTHPSQRRNIEARRLFRFGDPSQRRQLEKNSVEFRIRTLARGGPILAAKISTTTALSQPPLSIKPRHRIGPFSKNASTQPPLTPAH